MKMKALGGELFNVPVCTTVLFILFNVVLRAWAQKSRKGASHLCSHLRDLVMLAFC